MTITVSSIWIPIVLSLAFLIPLFKIQERRSWYDMDAIFSVLWFIPALLVWVVYLSARLWMAS